MLDNAYCMVQCNKSGKDPESIQSSTTPDPEYHMEKVTNTQFNITNESHKQQ